MSDQEQTPAATCQECSQPATGYPTWDRQLGFVLLCAKCKERY